VRGAVESEAWRPHESESIQSAPARARRGRVGGVRAACRRAGTSAEQYRQWIVEMKDSARGPFSGIKWYCKDGSVFQRASTPAPSTVAEFSTASGATARSSCARRLQGGDAARGHRREQGRGGTRLRRQLCTVCCREVPHRHRQRLDHAEGVVLSRRAAGGDEREGARNLLQAMAMRAEWTGYRFVALRTGVRMLPHGQDTASAQKVRQMAATLSDRDTGFASLRPRSTVRRKRATPPRAYLRGRGETRAAHQLRGTRARSIGSISQPLERTLEAAARAFSREPLCRSPQ